MPERWEHELRKLDEVEMPDGIRARAEQGPRGEGLPPARQRIVAATVAFAMFLGAGVFAWQALRPTGGRAPGEDVSEPALTDVTVTFVASNPGSDPDFPSAGLTVNGATVQGQKDNFEWQGAVVNVATPSYVDPVRLPLGSRVLIEGDADAVAGLLADPNTSDPVEDLRLTAGDGYLMAEPGPYFLVFEAKWAPDFVPFYFPIDVQPVEPDLTDADAELEITAYPFEAVLSYGGQRISIPETSGRWNEGGKASATGTASADPSERTPGWARIHIPGGTSVSVSGNWKSWTDHFEPGKEQVTNAVGDGGALEFPIATGSFEWLMSASWPEGEAEFAFGIELVASGSPEPSGALVTVPDVVGLGDQRAMLALDALGFALEPAYRQVEGVQRWRVAQIDPAPGTAVEAGTRVRLVIATEITPLPSGAVDALACPPTDHVAFGGPRFRDDPGGSAYITVNLGPRIGVEAVQVTFEAGSTTGWDGLWHVTRDGRVIAVVDYASLDGVACRGSGFAGA